MVGKLALTTRLVLHGLLQSAHHGMRGTITINWCSSPPDLYTAWAHYNQQQESPVFYITPKMMMIILPPPPRPVMLSQHHQQGISDTNQEENAAEIVYL